MQALRRENPLLAHQPLALKYNPDKRLWRLIYTNTYRTSEVAKIIGIHPNTVRLYEELGLIPALQREANGYRVFTDFHIMQFKLARRAFQMEVLQGGLRKKVNDLIKLSANKQFDEALSLAHEYVTCVNISDTSS